MKVFPLFHASPQNILNFVSLRQRSYQKGFDTTLISSSFYGNSVHQQQSLFALPSHARLSFPSATTLPKGVQSDINFIFPLRQFSASTAIPLRLPKSHKAFFPIGNRLASRLRHKHISPIKVIKSFFQSVFQLR